ncbi:MAG: AmmeMemoRadiSam system protein B [bacterium JZ-2024 1]
MREYQRRMAVADYFYPSSPEILKRMFSEWSQKVEKKERARMVILPHAGYIYSGRVAFQVLQKIEIPSRFLVFGPNHTGIGKSFAIFPGSSWATPFGSVSVDAQLSDIIVQKVHHAQLDSSAHREEHSVEVEVNLLHFFNPNGKLIAGVVSLMPYSELEKIGDELGEVLKPYADSLLLVASSDMSHYISESEARKKDYRALEAILALDEKELYRRVQQEHISMCGVAPVVVLLRAVKKMGATSARIDQYTSSAETTGDTSAVVGYAGVIIQ